MNIFDDLFNDMSGSGLYRAQVSPDLYPGYPRMLIENWSQQDVESYCGGA